MGSHAVPRNMEMVERLWKGVPDRYIWVAIGFLVIIGCLLITFFSMTNWFGRIAIAVVFLIVVFMWFLLARSPKALDKSLLFGLFYVRGAAGYNFLTKYSLTDHRINKLLTILKFMTNGTIVFKNGYGWIYAFDPDGVTPDTLEGFNIKAQALLNSLSDDIFFKIEVRVEPKQDAQKLTEHTNDMINEEKNDSKLSHLRSIYEYSKEKELNDVERKYYFFIGLAGKRSSEDAGIIKEKIEHGVQDKINNMNIIFSQIKDPYLLFEFYAGELR